MASLGIFNGLPGFPFSSSSANADQDASASEQWPSFVRIVDVADLPSLLFAHPNATNRHSSGSIWSNIFNIFTDGSEGTINDEMERENGAWFAIPGWNKAMFNGTGLGHSILPGLLVPAKIEPGQINDVANSPLSPLFNNFSNIFPLGFLFNHGQTLNLNPFNLPFFPESNAVNPLEGFKAGSLAPEKAQPAVESAEIKPLPENSETVTETPKTKEARRINKIRSILRRALNIENDENSNVKEGEKVVNLIEPVQETGMQMEPIPSTESYPESNSVEHGHEDTRSFGLLSSLATLLAGTSLKTLTHDPQSLGTLHEPTFNNGQQGQNQLFGSN